MGQHSPKIGRRRKISCVLQCFFADPIFRIFGSTWVNMGQHRPQDRRRRTEAFTHTEKSLHKGDFYIQNVLHREVFTLRSFCRQTSRSFYTQKFLHEEVFTQRVFNTQTRLHTEAFTHRGAFTHKSVYTQQAFTHKEAFTQRSLYTEELFTHRRFYTEKSFL